MKRLHLLFFFILIALGLNAQGDVSSWKNELKKWENKSGIEADTNLINIYHQLAEQSLINNPDTALVYYTKSLFYSNKHNIKSKEAKNLNGIGKAYFLKSDFNKSLDFYYKALKVNEEIGDKEGQAANMGNIALVQRQLGNKKGTLEYHLKALEIYEETGNKSGQAANLSNIGIYYRDKKDYLKALEYYSLSLNINEEINNISGIGTNIGNIAIIYDLLGDFEKSEEYYSKALDINRQTGNNRGLAINLTNLGKLYNKQKLYNKAEDVTLQALVIAKDLGDKLLISSVYDNLSDTYVHLNKHKEAYNAFQQYILYTDSVLNDENQKASIEKEMQYEFDKKEALQKAEQEKKDALNAEKSEKQVLQRNSFIIGFVLLLLLTIIVLRSYRNKMKDNEIISQQKKEVEIQKQLVEEKNHEITDSITYAKRIQSAMLPPLHLIKKIFPYSFVLFKPKDIVAGDFYWFQEKEDKLLFAIVDCTEHGVPGAMVSVVCNHALNRSIREYNLTDPGEILNKMNELLLQEFKKDESLINEGINISLCLLQNNQLTWSGANIPLWIIQKGIPQIEEYAPAKQVIGKHSNSLPFETHTIQLKEGDSIYTFTNGYTGQKGGDEGKELSSEQLREYLLDIQHHEMEVQKEILSKKFEKWKNMYEQTDDVCLIGIRL
ncbi:MAG: tetratricopeptide repeat protein [Brumimicrobium sp.]|nr:tetratricopeptide repeat protein [Brumimicrobium sp.]MCO5269956.1 tetratricopeptide repeat protein [Brumimicrobium sp.]